LRKTTKTKSTSTVYNDPRFDSLARQIYMELVPRGQEQDPLMQYRADVAVEAARRGWDHALQGAPSSNALQEAHQTGYQQGLRESQAMVERATSQSYQRGYNSALRTMDQSLNAAYQRGFDAGKQAALPPSRDSREDIIAEAMEQCRVIAESNPSMADGAKACKRMIKKLMR